MEYRNLTLLEKRKNRGKIRLLKWRQLYHRKKWREVEERVKVDQEKLKAHESYITILDIMINYHQKSLGGK